jgi:hypothetical protein
MSDNDKIAYRCLFSKLYITAIKLEAVTAAKAEVHENAQKTPTTFFVTVVEP